MQKNHPPLQIRKDIESSTLHLSGRLMSVESEEAIQKEMRSLLKTTELLKINLSTLDYINSSGLNILLKIFTQVRQENKELEIHQVSENVKKLFIMTKLNAVFTIVN